MWVANGALSMSLADPVRRVLGRVVEFLPSVLAALALVLVGWLTAYLLRAVCRRLTIYGLSRLARAGVVDAETEQHTLYRSLPGVVSGVVFWIVLLIFLAAGIEALGLEAVSALFSSLTIYLPRVLAAALIVFAGFVLGNVAQVWVARAGARAGIALSDFLGRAVQAVIWVVAILVTIEQLGINNTAIVVTLAIAAGSIFGASALAFGLGARATVSNIIAAHYVHKAYRVGNTVAIGDLRGRIVEISRTAVVLEAPEGRVQVPASRFNNEVSVLVQEGG